MTGRLKCNRKGWEKLKKRLHRFDQREIDIGFFKSEKYGIENDNLPVATVAYMNDQGTSQVPPRPFMTVDFKKHVSKTFKGYAGKFFKTLLTQSNVAFLQELKKIGQEYETELRDAILRYPGSNSPRWIQQKGFDDPLYHTGHMMSSVKHRIRRKEVR